MNYIYICVCVFRCVCMGVYVCMLWCYITLQPNSRISPIAITSIQPNGIIKYKQTNILHTYIHTYIHMRACIQVMLDVEEVGPKWLCALTGFFGSVYTLVFMGIYTIPNWESLIEVQVRLTLHCFCCYYNYFIVLVLFFRSSSSCSSSSFLVFDCYHCRK